MDSTQKSKTLKTTKFPNPLEALKDIGSSTAGSLKHDLIDKMPSDIMDQLFGPPPIEKKYSGDIEAGESVEIDEVYSGVEKENHKLRAQLTFEKKLQQEENELKDRKMNELRLQLKAISEQILAITKKTGHLVEELEIAAWQAPANPGIYHVIFFEQLLEFLKSFSAQIDEASAWLHSANKRSGKKGNVWGANYKKSGGKYLLSGEHYLQRSAG